MPRTVDLENRSQLLDRALDYVCAHGIASLSLRKLAEALDVSAGILLYHFGSKEQLIIAMLRQAGDRQRALFGTMRTAEHASPGEVCRAVWGVLSTPRSLQLFRLFFEVYGMALAAPERFPGFFPGAVSNWLAFLERSAVGEAANKTLARRRATVVLAGFRGFLLDLCATHERKRVDDAVEAWIASLDSVAMHDP